MQFRAKTADVGPRARPTGFPGRRLDLAADPKPTSRLGCQLVLSAELDGLEFDLPREANNLMDHIPFEDRA